MSWWKRLLGRGNGDQAEPAATAMEDTQPTAEEAHAAAALDEEEQKRVAQKMEEDLAAQREERGE